MFTYQQQDQLCDEFLSLLRYAKAIRPIPDTGLVFRSEVVNGQSEPRTIELPFAIFTQLEHRVQTILSMKPCERGYLSISIVPVTESAVKLAGTVTQEETVTSQFKIEIVYVRYDDFRDAVMQHSMLLSV